METQADHRYFSFRIYTSDIPHSSVVYPEYKQIGDYPYLMGCMYGSDYDAEYRDRQFVERLPRSNIEMTSISIHEDILMHIISYGPASWYTVSKHCKTVATQWIQKSEHIHKQWNNGAIPLKAFHEHKPEALNIFLDAKWDLSSEILMHIRDKKTISKLVQCEHVRELIKK